MKNIDLHNKLSELEITDRVDFIFKALVDMSNVLSDVDFSHLDFSDDPNLKTNQKIKINAKVKFEQHFNTQLQSLNLNDTIRIWNQKGEHNLSSKLYIITEIMATLFSEDELNKKYETDFKYNSMSTSLQYITTTNDYIRGLDSIHENDKIKLTFNLMKDLLDHLIKNENAQNEYESFKRVEQHQQELRSESRYNDNLTEQCPLCDENPCMCSDSDSRINYNFNL